MGTREQRDALNRLAKVGPRAAQSADDRVDADLLSISSVAEMIGVSKVELREVVRRPEFLARIRYKASGAESKPGRSLRIPRELVEDLRAAAKLRDDALEEQAGEPCPEPASSAACEESPPETIRSGRQEMSLAIVYERLLSEKDARIADMRAEIENLRGVLEREQNAHARAQALISLQAPPPIRPEAPAATDPEVGVRADFEAASGSAAGPDAPKPSAAPEIARSADTSEKAPDGAPTSSNATSVKRPFWRLWR